jgi:hypothetical protein
VRDLDLLNRWLVLQRQSALQYAHSHSLSPNADLLTIRALAHQAEFIERARAAVGVLSNDPAKFMKEYLGEWSID